MRRRSGWSPFGNGEQAGAHARPHVSGPGLTATGRCTSQGLANSLVLTLMLGPTAAGTVRSGSSVAIEAANTLLTALPAAGHDAETRGWIQICRWVNLVALIAIGALAAAGRSSSSAAAPGPRSSDSRPARNQAVHARGRAVPRPRDVFAETIVAVFGNYVGPSRLDGLKSRHREPSCNSTVGKVRGGRGGSPPLTSGLVIRSCEMALSPIGCDRPGRSGRT